MADISQIVLKDSSGNVIGTYNVKDTSVPHDSKAAVSGGTKLSLVTTGEKATWNAKADTDTKNTAGATNTTSKMYLIGARSQDTNPQTYSNSDTYYELGAIHAHKFKAHYSNDNGSVIIDGNGIVQCCNANNVAMSHISSGSDYYGGRAGLKDPTGTFDAVSLSGKDGLVCKSDDNTTTIQLNCSNGNIKCSTVNSHAVPKMEFASTQFTFTSSTSMVYLGKSVTCPSGARMLVRAYFRYMNGGPMEVAAAKNSTALGGYHSECYAYGGGSGLSTACLTFMLASGETAYYWAKYANATSNRIDQETITFSNDPTS